MTIEQVTMRQKYGTEAEWFASTVALEPGELGVSSDTRVVKTGDGVTLWAQLPENHSSTYATLVQLQDLTAVVNGLDTGVPPDGLNFYQATSGSSWSRSGNVYSGWDFPPAPFPNGSIFYKREVVSETSTVTYRMYSGLDSAWLEIVLPGGSTTTDSTTPTEPVSSRTYTATYPDTY